MKEIEIKHFQKLNEKEWEEIQNLSNNEHPIIKRLIANLSGLYIINSILIVDYCGSEDKKKIFTVYFLKHKKELTNFIIKAFQQKNINIENITTIKNVGGEVLKKVWIEYILSLKEPKNIKIIINNKEQK